MHDLLQRFMCGQLMKQPCRKVSHPVKLSFDRYGGETEAERKLSPLVILHGLFGHKSNWRSIAHNLHRRLKIAIFTLDLRNHGDSPWYQTMTYEEMANDVRYFIDEVIPQQIGEFRHVHLLGHSMGGKTAMRVALMMDSSTRLKSLIVEDIAPRRYSYLLSFPRIIEAMKCVELTRTRNEIEHELAAVVSDRKMRQFLMMNLVRVNEYMHRWRLNLDSIGRHLREICGPGIQDEGVYCGKCLFVSGGFSQYLMRADHPLILSRFPYAEFCVIPRAAHWVHADKPYEFMDAVTKFIRSVDSEK